MNLTKLLKKFLYYNAITHRAKSLTFLILHILTRIFLHITHILPVYMSVALFVFLCLSVLSVILSVCMYRRYVQND
jgi:hypothetical protein